MVYKTTFIHKRHETGHWKFINIFDRWNGVIYRKHNI